MMRIRQSRPERGVALLVALFALLLLSAIGLAMYYAADTETGISHNYRDKEIAVYSSMAGIQEGRDRIQPVTGDILTFAGLPSTSTANVVYIINPQAGESIEPWTLGSRYADTELCQENTMGLTGTVNVPCTTLPSGGGWYSVRDNSSTGYTGPFKLTAPVEYKWTRITLKADNMGAVPTRGAASNGTQVCWDGTHQIPLPDDYTYECSPYTRVSTIVVTNPGSGYNTAPNVTIGPPAAGGTQATAVANITTPLPGQITSLTLVSGGAGYTSAPTVTFTGGGGTGAAATATVVAAGTHVQSVNLTSPGAPAGCYGGPAPPTVNITGGAGSGATAKAALTGSHTCIYSFGVNVNCSGPANSDVMVGATGGGGGGFSARVHFKGNGKVQSVTIVDPGSGYNSLPTDATGIAGCSTSWSLGYNIASVTLTNGGSGYTSVPTVDIAPAPVPAMGATPPTATATLAPSVAMAGQVVMLNLTNPGSGYTSAPLVTLSGGGGAGATATASIINTGGRVTSITVTDHGSGYIGAPTVTLNGGGGTGATAKANITGGTYYGKVFMVTSLAETRSGARAMTQAEVVTPVRGMAVTGALTLDGPSPASALPLYASPNSQNFYIRGADGNSCSETAEPAHPAIGTYDDPNNPTTPTATANVINNLARPDHYTGENPAPDVQNVFTSLGEDMTTPVGLAAYMNAVASIADYKYVGPVNHVEPGTPTNPVIDYVDGDASLAGLVDGYGILAVTGELNLSGDFTWHGVVLVIGKGITDMAGGGNGLITGTVFVAQIYDNSGNLLPEVGSPTVNWDGGGGNGIQYDHCWADNLLSQVPYVPPPTSKPLKIVSTRTVTY